MIFKNPKIKKKTEMKERHLAILLVPFLRWLSDLLERLSDLQLRNQKVILNHLTDMIFSPLLTLAFRPFLRKVKPTGCQLNLQKTHHPQAPSKFSSKRHSHSSTMGSTKKTHIIQMIQMIQSDLTKNCQVLRPSRKFIFLSD